MKIADFLQQVSNAKVLPPGRIFAFTAQKEYPLLFTQVCIGWLKKLCHLEIFIIDVQTHTLDQIKSIVSISFLGTQKQYWISGVYSLDIKKRKKWLEFFQNYSGPHILFISQVNDDLGCATLVDLSGQFYIHQATDMLRLLTGLEHSKINYFLSFVYKHVPMISIDQICLFVYYVQVIGKDKSFFETLLPQIIGSKSSLFLLSQYLFSKQPDKFFLEWKKLASHYSPAFWTSFWSEQFWSASLYVHYMRRKEHAEAKLAAGRLPFSFLNQDWRLYSVTELQNAHNGIYALDVQFKSGVGHDSQLDLLYTNFLYSNCK